MAADAIKVLEQELEMLRREFERYFLGLEKRPPFQQRSEVERKFRAHNPGHKSVARFRYNNLTLRLQTLQRYWNRTLIEIEEGRYHRDVARANRKAASKRVTTPATPTAEAIAQSKQKAAGVADEAAAFMASLRGAPKAPQSEKPLPMRGQARRAEPSAPPLPMRGKPRSAPKSAPARIVAPTPKSAPPRVASAPRSVPLLRSVSPKSAPPKSAPPKSVAPESAPPALAMRGTSRARTGAPQAKALKPRSRSPRTRPPEPKSTPPMRGVLRRHSSAVPQVNPASAPPRAKPAGVLRRHSSAPEQQRSQTPAPKPSPPMRGVPRRSTQPPSSRTPGMRGAPKGRSKPPPPESE